jgi:hypothetical protein
MTVEQLLLASVSLYQAFLVISAKVDQAELPFEKSYNFYL